MALSVRLESVPDILVANPGVAHESGTRQNSMIPTRILNDMISPPQADGLVRRCLDFRCTNSIEIAAGVTPGTLEA